MGRQTWRYFCAQRRYSFHVCAPCSCLYTLSLLSSSFYSIFIQTQPLSSSFYSIFIQTHPLRFGNISQDLVPAVLLEWKVFSGRFARDALAKVVHRTYVPTAARAITLNFRPYMPCGSCTESGCINPPLYDHEHALLLCPEIMKFWTTVRNLILHISGPCFTSGAGYNCLSITTIFTGLVVVM